MLNSFSRLTNEQLLEILSFSAEAAAIYISEDLEIQYANDAMLRIWGREKTVIGKALEHAVSEIKHQRFAALLQHVWRTGKIYEAKEAPVSIQVDGEVRTSYFDFRYLPILDENGQTYCILHTAREVTELHFQQKTIEEGEQREFILIKQLAAINEELGAANEDLETINEELSASNEELNNLNNLLSESQAQLKEIIEQAPIGICVFRGKEMLIEVVNDVILKIWGRTREEVEGKPHFIARPELKDQIVLKWLDQVYETGVGRNNEELRILLHSPEEGLREAYVNSIYQPIKNTKGETTGIIVILQEITEQVKTKREHHLIQDMLNRAIEAAELGTFDFNPATGKFTGNDQLKSWFGLNPDDQVDLSLATATIDKQDRPRVEKAIRQALDYESGGNYEIDYTIIHPENGSVRTVRAKGKASFDENRRPIRLNGTVQDITERKRDEQRKNDFIGIVSHELKTPLTSVKAFLQLIHQRAEKEGKQFYHQISEKALVQTGKMHSLINGFLDVTRFDSGKIHLHKEWFNLTELIDEEVEAHKMHSPHHQIIFENTVAIPLYADREKISQVISNLIGNAVKYSPNGNRIEISCHHTDDTITTSVRDNGIGINERDLDKLFERFYRVTGADTKFISGFGIGLYLSSELIKSHHGKIWVESEPGQGSIFYFSLPANP
ncbi:PAS domain-containing sensor histidine kinase [Desertivirga xinjiangensis]|uniref:PAS domain-containing sensor histidine kinase n=1 Tax=Desertivirga xinjiangensis TaxID=539206 RepID=UPI00210A9220|nr:ATP-binding protein [Pedobacter xinjiangensis]